MPRIYLFYTSVALCALGWVFLGLGVILCPISLFCLFRAQAQGATFALISVLNIAGFSLSLYLDINKILQLIMV